MTSTHIIYLAVIFFAVFGAALAAMYFFVADPVRNRLHMLSGKGSAATTIQAHSAWVERAAKISSPFAKLSLPEEGWEKSPLRLRFMNAGIRDASAPAIFFGTKTILAVLFPLAVYFGISLAGKALGANATMFFLLLSAGFGYYLPNGIVDRIVSIRQREIFENFPDALDLLTVCIEAGLAMDASLVRVGEEMRSKSLALSDELHLVTLELRAGHTKENALRNLAIRTGVDDVDTLVAMLIQAEKFGTSIADSLRIHSDSLRVKRRQRAEEAAAKIALKLLFPLIFFIFPSLLMVLLGPAFIQIMHALNPAGGG
jgi:tight adherence protein C